MRGVWLSNTSVLYISREPKRMDDIRDRRNELAANISSQEIYLSANESAGWTEFCWPISANNIPDQGPGHHHFR